MSCASTKKNINFSKELLKLTFDEYISDYTKLVENGKLEAFVVFVDENQNIIVISDAPMETIGFNSKEKNEKLIGNYKKIKFEIYGDLKFDLSKAKRKKFNQEEIQILKKNDTTINQSINLEYDPHLQIEFNLKDKSKMIILDGIKIND